MGISIASEGDAVFDAAALVQRLIDAKPEGTPLGLWMAKKRKAVFARVTARMKKDALLLAPPYQAPKHHWIIHMMEPGVAGMRLVPTLKRAGVYAIHKRETQHDPVYVVDHVPSGASVQERRKLGQAREVLATLAEEFPSFGAAVPFGRLPSGAELQAMGRVVEALRERHGLR